MFIYTGPSTEPINKYHKWYINIIAHRQSNVLHRKDGYCEKHHIIPDSLGGSNAPDNLVNLTAREHFIVHVLLTKFLEGQPRYKMLKAVSTFKCSDNRVHNSRLYENARIEKSKFGSYLNLSTDEYEWFNEDPGEGYRKESVIKGMTYWYNPSTDTYKRFKENPCGEWIKQSPQRGRSFWYNPTKRYYKSTTISPGDGWIKQSPNKGKTFWHNPSTDTYTYTKDYPGEGYIKQGCHTNKKCWMNPITGEQTRSFTSPGDEWINTNSSLGSLHWHNPETNESIMTKGYPGDGWLKGTTRKGEEWWYNTLTNETVKAFSCPGEYWSRGRNWVGVKWYHNPKTDEHTRSSHHPGDGWVEGSGNIHKGKNNCKFNGLFCHIEYGEFESCSALTEALNSIISITTVRRACKKDNNTPINDLSYKANSYLQTLGSREEIVGKTWRDLGFYFTPKEDLELQN